MVTPLDEQIYTESELLNLRRMATQLGFWDDVAHWNKELKKLREGATA